MTPLCSRSIEDTSDLDIPKPLVDRLREAERFSDPEIELRASLPRVRMGLAECRPPAPGEPLPLRRAPARGARLPALRSERSRGSRAASFVGGTIRVAACGFAFAAVVATWLFLILVLGQGLAR